MEETVSLDRHLGVFGVFSVCSGTMVGAGIFLLPSLIAAKAGPASVLCFVVAGLISTCAALSVCELSTALPMSGGSYFFISRSMGSMFGAIVGWGTLLGLAFKGAFAFMGAGDYFNALLPLNPILVAASLCLIVTLVNIAGTRTSGMFQNLTVIILFSLLALFILRGLFSVRLSNFQPFFMGTPTSFMEATGLVFITYLGLIEVTAIAEEVRDPGRNLPRGILLSISSVTILYTLVMFVTKGLFPVGQLAHKLTPLADAAKIMAGSTGMVLIIICGLMATISTGNGALLASPRYLLAMGRDNLMPRILTRINSVTKTPDRSISLIGVIMLALILFFNLEDIAKLGSTFNILIFTLINASVLILRKADPEWYRPRFRSPLYPLVQIVGIIGSVIFIPFMGLAPSIGALAFIIFGISWYYLYGRGEAQPEYGLRTAVTNLREKAASQLALKTYPAPSRPSWKLLVPIWSTQVPSQLLLLSGYVARYYNERAQLVYCAELPPQTPPSAAERSDKECPDLGIFLAPLDEDIESHFEVAVLYTHSRSAAFIDFATEHEVGLAMMEWPPDAAPLHWELHSILRDMPCNLAIFVARPLQSLRSILVAASPTSNELKLQIAGAIASESGAEVAVLSVYPPNTQEMDKEDLERQIRKAENLRGVPVTVKTVKSGDVTVAIADESRKHDLLVMGSAPIASWLRPPFGALVEEVIDSTECCILVTHPPSATRVRRKNHVLNQRP